MNVFNALVYVVPSIVILITLLTGIISVKFYIEEVIKKRKQ